MAWKIRQNTKRKYIAEKIQNDTKRLVRKRRSNTRGLLMGLWPEALHQMTRVEYNSEPNKIATKTLSGYPTSIHYRKGIHTTTTESSSRQKT